MSEKTTSLSQSPNRQHDGAKPKKLLDQVSEALRAKHYAYRTEKLVPNLAGGPGKVAEHCPF